MKGSGNYFWLAVFVASLIGSGVTANLVNRGPLLSISLGMAASLVAFALIAVGFSLPRKK